MNRIEPFEDRLLLSTFTVVNAGESGTGLTLRQAIDQANANPGLDTINFNIGAIPGIVRRG